MDRDLTRFRGAIGGLAAALLAVAAVTGTGCAYFAPRYDADLDQQASRITAMQKRALGSALKFVEFETLATAQKLLDMAIKLVGAAILNRTGIDVVRA